ncbi:UNVERIFIED_ORG: VOC family protein [Shinella sp. XGS7]|nr:VOC family protein [Shinella sp. XGS7]
MELNTVRLFVRDLAAARAFYADVLDLPLQAANAELGYCVFAAGRGVTLVVERVEAQADAEEQALVGRFSGLSFAVPDLEARYQALQARGVVFSGAPELQAWGGRLATLLDPAGNALQLVQLPAA